MGAGLVLGVRLSWLPRAAAANANLGVFAPNAWVRIASDGTVTVVLAKSEMGQGVLTSLPLIVAEELEADWPAVRIENAPVDPIYNDPIDGEQATSGDTSTRGSFLPLRRAGAAAREMLIGAAAAEWGVPSDECHAERSAVHHRPTGRTLGYGQLAERAAKLPVPTAPRLKDPRDFKLIGKVVARRDAPGKVNGSAVFGIDVKVPDLLVGAVARCPVFGGTLASVDPSGAMAVKGVRSVVRIDSGVAVVADTFWAARRGRDALVIKWNEGPLAGLGSPAIARSLREAVRRPGVVARSDGDAPRALRSAARRLEAVYEVPYLAHATMEPMNCTAHVRADGCDVWVPTQAQGPSRNAVVKVTGLPPEAVAIHTTLLGGGFGRRSEVDFVIDAVQASKAVGAPVKVIWTREDDMQHDFYRPVALGRLAAGLDARRRPVAWTQRLVGPSLLSRVAPQAIKDGVDFTSVMGAASLPYAIPNLRVEYVRKEPGVPVGFLRSVGDSFNAFMTECFLDELAAAAGRDPYELRRDLLVNKPRHLRVLELAARHAGWGRPLPKGSGRGIALHGESFDSYVAQVAEVTVAKDGQVRVHRVVCAIDCGIVVNPDTVRAQMEGGIVFGLTAALHGAITLDRGRVQQSNFHDYPMVRMPEAPAIEVHIAPSAEAPGGVGEAGVPAVTPAVVNAIFAATGKRLRRLPISAEALRAST